MPLPAPADDLFRAELRQFMAAQLPEDLRQASRRNAAIFADRDTCQRWTRILAARGWSVPHWPLAWGGTGWTPQQHDIFASELAAADAPVLAPQGARLPVADAGAHALARPEDPVWAMSAYLNDRAASIYGGTNEVQRKLIARHLTGPGPCPQPSLED